MERKEISPPSLGVQAGIWVLRNFNIFVYDHPVYIVCSGNNVHSVPVANVPSVWLCVRSVILICGSRLEILMIGKFVFVYLISVDGSGCSQSFLSKHVKALT